MRMGAGGRDRGPTDHDQKVSGNRARRGDLEGGGGRVQGVGDPPQLLHYRGEKSIPRGTVERANAMAKGYE